MRVSPSHVGSIPRRGTLDKAISLMDSCLYKKVHPRGPYVVHSYPAGYFIIRLRMIKRYINLSDRQQEMKEKFLKLGKEVTLKKLPKNFLSPHIILTPVIKKIRKRLIH